jgi:hypothetical protein
MFYRSLLEADEGIAIIYVIRIESTCDGRLIDIGLISGIGAIVSGFIN